MSKFTLGFVLLFISVQNLKLMKKKLLYVAIIIASFNTYAQITFEKGYFIDNNNKTIECYIKNLDWNNNPTKFKYKTSLKSTYKTKTIDDVIEFGINKSYSFIRKTVNIDRSSNHTKKLTEGRSPKFKEETLLLKLLVKGKSNLYSYKDNNITRYFYSKNNATKQLIFKKFKYNGSSKIGINTRYKQQLWNGLKCDKISKKNIKNLSYTKQNLVSFFIKYNNCYPTKVINYEQKVDRDFFNLSIKAGIATFSLDISNSSYDTRDVDFGNKNGFIFGIENEFILPFNKGKWAIIVEPTYRSSFKSKKTTQSNNVSGGLLTTSVNYRSIEVPIGVRYYFILNKKSKIYVNASYIIDIPFKDKIKTIRGTNGNSYGSNLDVKSNKNLALNIGYKALGKYSIELRYQTPREIISNNSFWNSNYKSLAVAIGYTLF